MLKGSPNTSHSNLIRQLPKSTVFVNERLEIVHASDRWISEFKLDSDCVFGKPITEILTGISHDWEQQLQTFLLDNDDETMVSLNRDTQEGRAWYEWTCTPWYDEQENIIGLIITTDNITELKMQEEQSKTLLRHLIATSEIGKIGSWEYYFDQKILTWCPMTRKLHEVEDDFVPDIDKAINFYKDGHSRNTMAMYAHEAMENGTPFSDKFQIVTAKGKEIWVRCAGRPIFDDEKLLGFTGTFQDIDEQVTSEIKTQENETLLRTLIDNLPVNIFVKDRESRKILVNKAECEFLGFENPEELLGKTNADILSPELAQRSDEQDMKVMETLVPLLSHEDTFEKKNGDTATLLVSKIPFLNDAGKAKGLIGISMDISELKQKESELRNLVNMASIQNKKLINFTHIVSHNLRSHTANFAMLLDLLVHEKEESEKNKIQKMLQDASDNLLETLENLNEVIDINTNVNLDKKPIALKNKIDKVVQNLSSYLNNHKALIINKVDVSTKVKVVPAYIDSILMNFITNSVKYKDPNRDARIIFSANEENGYTVLSISDNGLGIDLKKYERKLFGMYKTFHDHSDARGIGLFITKNQIEAMNGKVSVTSEVGTGTTFKIYFNEKNG